MKSITENDKLMPLIELRAQPKIRIPSSEVGKDYQKIPTLNISYTLSIPANDAQR